MPASAWAWRLKDVVPRSENTPVFRSTVPKSPVLVPIKAILSAFATVLAPSRHKPAAMKHAMLPISLPNRLPGFICGTPFRLSGDYVPPGDCPDGQDRQKRRDWRGDLEQATFVLFLETSL